MQRGIHTNGKRAFKSCDSSQNARGGQQEAEGNARHDKGESDRCCITRSENCRLVCIVLPQGISFL